MKVRCVHKRGNPIPESVLALGNTPSTVFDVTFDRAYNVFGICFLRNGVIQYLVLNDVSGRPDWLPEFLFKVVKPQLPSGWSFLPIENPSLMVRAICGYPELAQTDGKHYIDLVEREQDALEVFSRRRAEMEVEELA